jgi:hypothetical protein
MLKMIMPVLAGAGLREFTSSIEKLMKAMGAGAKGQDPGNQAAGASAASPTGAPAPGAQIDPAQIFAIMQMVKARQGATA